MVSTKQDYLIVIDMQNDFISGSLGSSDAQAILPKVKDKIQHFQGPVIFTMDT
ncbi:MAG: isochorismatase family protein, partial [Veillonella sp.]|nr:isochorismatase family protein [Veillonella sp.]